MPRAISAAIAIALLALPGNAADLAPRPGWEVLPTSKSHADLVADTRAAVNASALSVITQAGPTGAAAARGIEIPGNVVIGIYNNDFAVRVLRLSTPAMIEAPIRLYVTENADGTATLGYKRPSFVFAAYAEEGGEELMAIAAELDRIFADIAAAATR